jgi:bifunctional non-homologous end joining protein LigD
MAVFVVQRHKARTLHYDFRLEIEGVLKSWAIPKGPSLDPSVTRLAIMVEDHELSFATFEGRIPAGHYGAGEIKIWDHGSWELTVDRAYENLTPAMALSSGRLCFALLGNRLTGEWRLTRRGRTTKEWFLTNVTDKRP